jgi:hypothetical protein
LTEGFLLRLGQLSVVASNGNARQGLRHLTVPRDEIGDCLREMASAKAWG